MGSRKWNKEELEYLENKWGIMSVSGIAKNLNRPVKGVRAKALRIGLDRPLEASEKITVCELINVLGLKAYTWEMKKFEKHGCPITTQKVISKSYKVIDIEQFWKWAEKHQEILNFKNFNENTLGKEPIWVKEKRKRDIMEFMTTSKNKAWTKEEENLLIAKVKSYRYTCAELANEFNRSESSIKRKLQKLKVPYRPITKRDKEMSVAWTVEENKYFLELYRNNYSIKEISKRLNKDERLIQERVELLKSKIDTEFKNRPWSITEEKYLFKYKDKKTAQELALELDRSYYAVRKKIDRLNINLIQAFSEQAEVCV